MTTPITKPQPRTSRPNLAPSSFSIVVPPWWEQETSPLTGLSTLPIFFTSFYLVSCVFYCHVAFLCVAMTQFVARVSKVKAPFVQRSSLSQLACRRHVSLALKAKTMTQTFSHIELKWVRREDNTLAD